MLQHTRLVDVWKIYFARTYCEITSTQRGAVVLDIQNLCRHGHSSAVQEAFKMPSITERVFQYLHNICKS